MIALNEVFQTVQGEGHHTGTPATFLRLHGCAVGCPWCDTKYTWDVEDIHRVPLATVLRKKTAAAAFAYAAPGDLIDIIRPHNARHVVITGGEPANQDLTQLSTLIITELGRSVQIETSGTYPIRIHRDAWVTVSPKVNMPGRLVVRNDAIARADEIKMPVGSPRDIEVLQALLRNPRKDGVRIYLQPLSRSEKATKLCVEAATIYGWRVSIQTHAYLNWR